MRQALIFVVVYPLVSVTSLVYVSLLRHLRNRYDNMWKLATNSYVFRLLSETNATWRVFHAVMAAEKESTFSRTNNN